MEILKKKWFPPLLIVAAILIFTGLKSLKKDPIKEKSITVAPLVKTETIELFKNAIQIHGTGEVRSTSEVMLTPQVAGVIKSLGKNTSSGSSFKKGDLLFQIEKDDYFYRMQAAKAEVARHEVTLKSEQYESEIAKQEWEEYSENSDEKASPLTLREPQLNMAKANLQAAKANYNMAMLNYKRTKIVAPFDGQIKQRLADVGQYVAPGTQLASIFNSKRSEIRVAVQPRDIDWIEPNQKVTIKHENKSWNGVVKTVGSNLDSRSRLATVTVNIENPYSQSPKLLNGLFVDVYINGKQFNLAYEVERHQIKNENTLWLLSDGKLSIRTVEVLYHGKTKSYVRFNLKEGEKLIISSIDTPIDGMELRTN